MAGDYIRRDLAKKRFSKRLMWLKEDVHDEYSGALLDGCEADIELLDEIPAADVAEVTRCKDCKYVRNLGFNFGGLRHDSYFCVYNGPISTGGDDFCSHGDLQTNGGGNDNVSD